MISLKSFPNLETSNNICTHVNDAVVLEPGDDHTGRIPIEPSSGNSRVWVDYEGSQISVTLGSPEGAIYNSTKGMQHDSLNKVYRFQTVKQVG